MKQLQKLYEKHYTTINSIEYRALYNDMIDGYISILRDEDLNELLDYFIDVSIQEIESALYDGTLSFYKCGSDYIAILES